MANKPQPFSMAPHERTYSVAPHGQYVQYSKPETKASADSGSSSEAGSQIAKIFDDWARENS